MKPTVVLCPGAWHAAASFRHLARELATAGYPAQLVNLRTVGTTKPLCADISYLKNEVYRPLVSAGKDVLVVLHSLAGFPGSIAIKGLSKAERGRDKKGGGGIVGVVCIAAVLPVEGISVTDMMGGELSPWTHTDEEAGLVFVNDPRSVFYHDVPEELANEALETLNKGQSLASFRDKAGPVGISDAGFNGRRAYIFCSDDQALLVMHQEIAVNGTGLDWTKKHISTSHSPFLSAPRELARMITELAESWQLTLL